MPRNKIDIDCARSGILNKHVLAALSGGADSVALVFLLWEKHLAGEIRLTLAHFEHGIRAEESKRDQAFVTALSERLKLTLITEEASVPEEARKTGEGTETCARRLRHEFLKRAKTMCGADVIATAHHKGDQAETVLMHILRGGGLSGARGMCENDGMYVRPLIHYSKEEIIRYLLGKGESWCEDSTNASLDNPRNLLRLKAIPFLRAAYPGAEDAIARFSEIARDEDEYMDRQAQTAFEDAAERFLGVWMYAKPETHPAALARRIIRKMHPDFSFDEIEKIRACQTRISLSGGWWAMRKNGYIFIVPPLEAPEETPFSPDTATALEGICEITPVYEEAYKSRFSVVERVNPAPLAGASLRTRREGDFIRPLGMGGKRKLVSDVMTDRKIPLPFRDRIPVLAKDSEVFWIVGSDISETIKTDRNTESIALKANFKHTYGGKTK